MTADRAIKEPCRAATSADISLSGLQTIDGISLAANDRVLVRAQTSAADNGLYEAASGAWPRAGDADGVGEIVGGTQILVTSGTQYAGSSWRVAGNGAVAIGSDPIAFLPAVDSDSVAFLQSGSGAIARTVEQKFREEAVSVLDFRDPGDIEDTDAVALALAAGRPVYFPGGRGLAGDGAYIVESVEIPAGAFIFGDGPGLTVLIRPDSDVEDESGLFQLTAPCVSDPVENVTIRDLTLTDDVEERHFLEAHHLIRFRGVRNLLVENVHFIGFRGDGLALIGEATTPTGPSDYRHNSNITVRDCLFDGINRDNRNGITLTDGTNVLIDNCRFQNVTKSDMPGAIDFEPSPYSGYLMGNCTVSNCTFTGCGGGGGIITVVIPEEISVVPTGFRFVDNRMDDNPDSNLDYLIDYHRVFSATDSGADIVISGHHGRGGNRPFGLAGVKGVMITETCSWETYFDEATIGDDRGADGLARDVECRAKLVQTGTGSNKFGLTIKKAIGLTLRDMLLDRCGYANSGYAPIFFQSGDTSDYVVIERMRLVPNTGQTKGLYGPSHTFTPAHNRSRDNDFGGLSSDFSEMPRSFIPAIEGTTSAGSATFSDHGSYFWVVGNTVFIDYFEAWSAHSGTGQLKVGLPLAPAELYAPFGIRGEFEVTVTGAGGAIASGEIVAVLNPSVDMSASEGSIQLGVVDQTAGSYAAFNVPNTTTYLRIRGSYAARSA